MTLTSYRKPLLLIVIFIMLITAVRLIWMNFLNTLDYPNPPAAKDGILDLRNFSFNERQTLKLDGEWEFYPFVFLIPSDQNPSLPAAAPVMADVPRSWNEFADMRDGAFRYGSYRLQIRLNPDDTEHTNQTFGIRLSCTSY